MIRSYRNHREFPNRSVKLDRNFRTDDGVYEWSRLQADRKAEGFDVTRIFFLSHRSEPFHLLAALGGVRREL